MFTSIARHLKMSSAAIKALLDSAPSHRGLKDIDPSLFTRSIPVLAARIPAKKTTTIRKTLGP
jgi:hypothetical protein